jgi:predicted N-acetyltransferase YhbS
MLAAVSRTIEITKESTMLAELSQLVQAPAIASELLASSVGAIVAASTALAYRSTRNALLQRRFPVGGDFISYFEDEVEGERVVVTSHSRLKQRGKDITGVNWAPDGRAWVLEGSVIHSNHITGIYHASSPRDQGIGVFYLDLVGDDLDGIWVGYDHANRKTTHGRYWFRRKSSVRVLGYQPKHRAAVLQIISETLGAGYLMDIDSVVRKPNVKAFVAVSDERVKAFAFGFVCEPTELQSILTPHTLPLPLDVKYADDSGRLAVIQTVAVAPSLQGRGVGRTLMETLESALKKSKAELIVTPAWSVRGAVNLAGTLRKLGHVEWETIANYWKAQCDADAFRCPARTDSCVCDVVWFKKTL